MAAKKGLEVKVTLESPSKEKIREYRTQIRDIQKKIKEVIDDMYGGTPKIKKIIKRGPGLFL